MNDLGLIHGSDAPEKAPEILERIVRQAYKARASDIHIQMRSQEAEIGLRLDGVLSQVGTIPSELADRLCGRIKYLANLKTYQDSMPQDGRIDKDSLHAPSDVRVASYPTVTGEKIVLRLFQETAIRNLNQLQLPADILAELGSFLARAAGLLLLTGPAGSGKTTTIYACLQHLVQLGGRHIITIEDPAEQVLSGIMQTETNEARGLDFARAARHLLRQDPQVLVIGEIRDEETARIALRASLTGHMILSTIHAGSCQGVLERLVNFCPELPHVSTSRDLILNQRLVRCLCRNCEGKGCDVCLGTGYTGRVPLIESLVIDQHVRQLVKAGQFCAVEIGLPLAQRAGDLVAMGLTDQREIDRVL